jgi:large subunit ribosomal protein L29
MKARALRDLSLEELQVKEKELQRELFNLRFQLATGQIEDVNRIGSVRKDIARTKTILREYALGIDHRKKE